MNIAYPSREIIAHLGADFSQALNDASMKSDLKRLGYSFRKKASLIKTQTRIEREADDYFNRRRRQ